MGVADEEDFLVRERLQQPQDVGQALDVTRASARFLAAAASSRCTSAASGGCALSCPIFSKFCKLTGIP